MKVSEKQRDEFMRRLRKAGYKNIKKLDKSKSEKVTPIVDKELFIVK